MTFDELQKTWQKNESTSKLIIDPVLLAQVVKRNKEAFESSIYWRDFREVAVALIMVGVFLFRAFQYKNIIWEAGAYVFLAIMCLYVAAFFIVDRRLQRKKKPSHTSLLGCIESSLIQVNHQIWLLRNVFWWYLLPPGIGIALFFIVVTVNKFRLLPAARVLFGSLTGMLIVVLVFCGVYWLNQYAVRKELIPRKNELEALLKSLSNDNKIT
jgi:hypothetical protein